MNTRQLRNRAAPGPNHATVNRRLTRGHARPFFFSQPEERVVLARLLWELVCQPCHLVTIAQRTSAAQRLQRLLKKKREVWRAEPDDGEKLQARAPALPPGSPRLMVVAEA